MTKFRLLMMIGFIVALLGACEKKTPQIPELRLGHAPHDHHSPLYIAAMNPEYFKANGGIYMKEIVFKEEYQLIADNKIVARVLIDSSTGGNELIRKLSENIFDMSFGGVPAMLSFIDKGSGIHILAPSNAEGAGLVIDPKIAVNSWLEFLDYVRSADRPIRIGYKIDVSVQNIIFESALEESGISYSSKMDDLSANVVLVNLHGAKNLIPALKDGLIDGFVVMQPFVAMAEDRGVGKTIAMLKELPPEGKWRGNPCCALAANDLYAQKYPEAAQALTTLILRANKMITAEPQKSAVQIAKWLGISPNVEKKSIPTIKFMADFNNSWNAGVHFWVDEMVEVGKLNNVVKKAHQAGKLEELIYDHKIYETARAASQ